jgi:hypothetical protein
MSAEWIETNNGGTMASYLVESYDHAVDHGGRRSAGVLGENKGKEKIYLHVLSISDVDIKKLTTRVDESGNKQHDRLALPRNEEWWIAVDGEVAWPKLHAPRVFSRCNLVDGAPQPAALSDADLERLRKSGVGDVPRG